MQQNAIQHYPVPSVGKAARNALYMKGLQTRNKGDEIYNALSQKKLDTYDEDREAAEQDKKYQIEARAISTALKAGNTEQATQIYKGLGGKSEAGISIAGKDVSIDYGDSTLKGPASVVAEMMGAIAKDPKWAMDPKTKAWFASNGGSFEVKEVKQTPAEKLRDQKELAEYKAGLKDSTGMEITTADGTIIRTGVKHGQKATKPVKTDVQKKSLEANATYADLKNTVRQYDDKYLMGRDKVKYFTNAFKEKWSIGDVSSEEKKDLREYTKFKRDSIATLNNYIKQITGAAMSNEEAKRLMKGMPNPGVKLFDGDSPTEFKAKMDGVMQSLDRVIARNNYVNKYGLKSFKDIGLDQMDGIIDNRGEEIEAEIKLKHPDKTDQEIEETVLEQLSEEFGIRF